MIKIAIVDDNKYHISDIKQKLSETPGTGECEICEFTSAVKFAEILDFEKFDIIFLDIVLGEQNGIELGKLVNTKQPSAKIIFVSANSEYFQDVYKVEHSYFLVKDLDFTRFNDAISRVMKNIGKKSITLDTKTGKSVIVLNDVLYFESALKRTRVYKTNGETEEYSVNMKTIETMLPEGVYIRTHQSFIVNMNHIQKYDRQSIFLINEKRIPISRTHINNVRTQLTRFLGGIV
ncbi:MAG: response regulator transcription factor [Clostridia bacterium]|nr:response regulator transcription factor [Clostridia bacterium]